MKDFHIHMYGLHHDSAAEFLRKTSEAGIDGGAVYSIAPPCSITPAEEKLSWEARLDKILEFTSQTPGFIPVLWFDPTEPDALKQVQVAAERGIRGFKVICELFYPKDGLKAYQAIADTGLPLTFHSGILYDPHPSSEYNRPVNFECLCEVKGLRFAMAHIGWPWCEEYMAVYGFHNFFKSIRQNGTEMFIDLTPGTPASRRSVWLKMVYDVGYDVLHNVVWGTDSSSNDYSTSHAKSVQDEDRAIYAEIEAEKKFPAYNPQHEDLFKLATELNYKRFYNL